MFQSSFSRQHRLQATSQAQAENWIKQKFRDGYRHDAWILADPKNKHRQQQQQQRHVEKKLISFCGSSTECPAFDIHTINVNEAQQQFARQDAKEATNNGSQKLTRAMDTSSWPASQQKQTNKHVLRQTTTKGKHQQLDMWEYQRPRISKAFFPTIDTFYVLTIWSRVASRVDSIPLNGRFRRPRWKGSQSAHRNLYSSFHPRSLLLRLIFVIW